MSIKEKQTQLMDQLEQERSKQRSQEREILELKQRLQSSDHTIRSLNQQITSAKEAEAKLKKSHEEQFDAFRLQEKKSEDLFNKQLEIEKSISKLYRFPEGLRCH